MAALQSHFIEAKHGMARVEYTNEWLVFTPAVSRCCFNNAFFYLFVVQDLLCTINVQHDCASSRCGPTGVQHVYQERHRTETTRPIIMHSNNPDLMMLNTAQMWDVLHLQKFRIPSAGLQSDDILKTSAEVEISSRKALPTKVRGKGTRKWGANHGVRGGLQRPQPRHLEALRG
jgi:hypothetical protein